MHNAPNVDIADLEAKDLLLESASIRFSSRMLYEITKGSCQPDEHAAIGALADRTCVLDDESVGLKGLTDMLSYAASRLENLGRSAPPVDGTNGQRALIVARIGSMEHLYRIIEWSSHSRESISTDRRVACTWRRHASSSDWLANTWILNVAFVHAAVMSTQRGCRNCPSSRTS
jgi:hypothetical protein